MIRMAPIADSKDDSLCRLKKWASQPWETNLVHVSGLAALEADYGVWVQKALVTFCSMTASATGMAQEEAIHGFMLVREGGFCDGRGELLSTDADDAETCAYFAKGSGATAFLLGSWFLSWLLNCLSL